VRQRHAKALIPPGNPVDEEFIALPVAATIAYFHVSESDSEAGSEEHLAEVIPLVAIALSTVAPIYMSTGNGSAAFVLSSQEVKDLLFRSPKAKDYSMENLVMHRQDVDRAMVTLKEARIAFGKDKRA
jgi:uncharacterized protein (DUF849 family)